MNSRDGVLVNERRITSETVLNEGDEIVIGGYEGRVTSLDLRYTTLQVEQRTVFIPNSKLFTDSVVLTSDEELDATEEEVAAALQKGNPKPDS